jgi:asparagine synthase (glutamine-hydrolysing)
MKFLLQIDKDNNRKEISSSFLLTNNYLAINYTFDNRKPSDSFIKQNERYIVLIIGVLFEDNEIKDRENYYFDQIVTLYEKYDMAFPTNLRGCFCGFIYDVKSAKTIVFTDHSSCRRIFYYENEKFIVFSSDINELISYAKKNRFKLELDINGSKMMLQNGYMIGDSTLVKNIKKLLPGTSFKYELSKKVFFVYYSLNDIPVKSIQYDDAIDEMEILFSKAVKREFDRDLLDKKKHLITLSGGLDSRAVRMVAKDLGYNNATNVTMSQSGYLDYSIALEISRDSNDDFIFFSLDNGRYLFNDILLSCRNNGGTALYNGNAHIDFMIDNLNTNQYGILHTGMIGDVIAGGSFVSSEDIDFSRGLYSSVKGFHKYEIDLEYFTYSNQEMNLLYNRGINGAFNGIYSSQRTMEAYSPFIDPDFMYFMYSLPRNFLKDSKIYIDWMKKYHKYMLDYKWEKTNLKPNSNRVLVFAMRIYRALHRRIFKNNKKSMNPYDYWYRNNVEFREKIQSEYNMAFNNLKKKVYLVEVLNELHKKNKTINKLLTISLYYSLINLEVLKCESDEND